MKEIKCPHCHQVFSVDESEYAELLSQVRTTSFNEELNRRIAEIHETKEAERKAALAELSRTSDKEKAEKDALIQRKNAYFERNKQIMQNKFYLGIIPFWPCFNEKHMQNKNPTSLPSIVVDVGFLVSLLSTVKLQI